MARTDPTAGSVACQPSTRAGTLRRILLGALLPALVPGTSLAQPADAPGGPDGPAEQRVFELRNGRWFDGRGFVERTMYTQHGVFVDSPTAAVDSVIDLRGRWVVPPYGEAHNHNVEAGPGFEDRVRRYLSHGVFYVKNPNVLPSGVFPIRDDVNRPGSIDVAFAFGGFTAPGGHPIGVVRRNVRRGVWTEAQGEGAFYYAVEDPEDLERKWPALLAHRPDFVKTYLLHSEEYDRRASDSAYVGQRGLDPELLPEIVERAHRVERRVSTHVETAADFRHALDAGVDEIAHLPGFRGNEENRFPEPGIFLLEEEDARRAARQGTVVVTTLADFADSAPDSVVEAARRVFRHNLRLLHRHGVRLAVGSDGYGSVGVSEAMQLHDLGVLTNRELLTAWVETTPRTIFPHRKIGRLEPGNEASFLVLGTDPLLDFSATQEIVLRFKRGRLLSATDGASQPERQSPGAPARMGVSNALGRGPWDLLGIRIVTNWMMQIGDQVTDDPSRRASGRIWDRALGGQPGDEAHYRAKKVTAEPVRFNPTAPR